MKFWIENVANDIDKSYAVEQGEALQLLYGFIDLRNFLV